MSGFLFNLRKYWFNRNIKQNRPVDIKRKGSSLKKAQRIGILFDASSPQNIQGVEALCQQLEKQQKEVIILGYKPQKEKEETLPAFVFSKESISWTFVPESETINRFIQEEFDILFCLQLKNYLPIEYIMALSKAKFRIGRYFESQENQYDLMFDIGEPSSLDKLSESILQQLNLLHLD